MNEAKNEARGLLEQPLRPAGWVVGAHLGGLAVGLLPTPPPQVKFIVKKGGEVSGPPWEPHGNPIIYWKL